MERVFWKCDIAMLDRDVSAIEDHGHLTESQRKHIDAMEEKQAAKEKASSAAKEERQAKHGEALQDAARAMDRIGQDHTHKLGWRQ